LKENGSSRKEDKRYLIRSKPLIRLLSRKTPPLSIVSASATGSPSQKRIEKLSRNART